MVECTPKLNYLQNTANKIIKSISALYGVSEDVTFRESVDAFYESVFGYPPEDEEELKDGSIASKLRYLNTTKWRFFDVMRELRYDVHQDTTFREAANLLYADACDVIAENLDVSSLPDYWQNDVKAAYSYVLKNDEGYIHHIVISDQHYNKNYKQSKKIVSVLQGTNKFSKLLILGDNADTNTVEEYGSIIEDYKPYVGDLLLVNGNHDSTVSTTLAAYYSELLEENDDFVWGSTTYLYYYWDDVVNHIRYICLNSSISSANASAQNTFFSTNYNNMPSGWTCIVLSHFALFTPKDKDGNERDASGGTTISVDAYRKKIYSIRCFSNTPQRFSTWLHGHFHADSITTAWNTHQFTFNTDSHKPSNRIAGTTTEQSITIFSINPTTGDMKTYRIGFAADNYYRQMTANSHSRMPDGLKYGFYPDSNGGFTSGNHWVTIFPAFEYQYGVKELVVYRRDFSSYSGCIADFYNDNGDYINRQSTYNDAPNAHFRYMRLVYLSSANYATKCNLGLQESAITAENYETEMQNFVICYNSELPIFTNWTLEDAGWVEDYDFENNSFKSMENAATTNKLVSCSPGQKLTFSVDDPDWSTPWAYFYFFKKPYKANITTRIGSSSTTKTITATVPSGCYYYFLSAKNLKGYTDKVMVTVE